METEIIRTLVYNCLCDIISEEKDGNDKCDICGKSDNNISLIMEPNYNSDYKCQRCDFVSYNSTALIIHERSQMKKKSTVSFCNLCTFKSCSSSGVEKHYRKNHPGQKFQLFKEEPDDVTLGHTEVVKKVKNDNINGHSEIVKKKSNIMESINGSVKCFRCDFVSNAANAKRHKKYQRQDLKFCTMCSFKSCSSGFLLRSQSFTSLMVDLRQDINRVFFI